MSIKPIEMYTVICDRCEKDAGEGEEICAWNEDVFAIETAESNGWIRIDDKHYCSGCVEWNEDESELIPKEPIKKD